MNEAELFTKLEPHVKEDISAYLSEQSLAEIASLALMESLIRKVTMGLVRAREVGEAVGPELSALRTVSQVQTAAERPNAVKSTRARNRDT